MKKTLSPISSDHVSKIIVSCLLYLFAFLITLSGLIYTFICIHEQVSLYVFNHQIPGYLFGIIISFLGIRYLYAVYKLTLQLQDPQAVFSWRNYAFRSKK